ncbi:cysteine hydrolase family protein [Micromonospora sp. C28ISP2-4]|uniref:cysteine hydrolase family protein n=1 Tax=Micromonospora sp. C28ISP2-4 TaxID=3059523 RepID=UPI0026766F6A|nr:isochorismatase family cysteine hydrolase [Micromonospora sp. C28ISP2-4]MDO3686088.1 isochorismatase family cysteine hydrolase [Micromonospora sp. C28ISP2-4]
MAGRRAIYGDTGDGGVQLAASTDRWHLYPDHVLLAPDDPPEDLLRFDAELMPFADNPRRGALVVVDMQNDFCAEGGWTHRSGLDYQACREAIPGVVRAVEAARRHDMFVIWVYWHNRPDLRNLGAPTLHSFKHTPDQAGIGQRLDHGRVLTAGEWGAEMVDELKPLIRDDDVMIEKVRMSGFYGTHLDQVLRTQGIHTLFVCGVNVDQCVSTTIESAYFRDYNPVLVADATATSSPAYCKDAVVFNAKQCWGFVTTTDRFADPSPYRR